MMHKLLIVLLIIYVLAGCQPTIKNDEETLSEIFAFERFEIEIGQFGCFGDETDVYSLERFDSTYLLTYLKSKESINLNPKDIDSLKSFFKMKIGTNHSVGLCTGTTYFRAGTYFNSVDFLDKSCRDLAIIDKIMGFSKVANKEY